MLFNYIFDSGLCKEINAVVLEKCFRVHCCHSKENSTAVDETKKILPLEQELCDGSGKDQEHVITILSFHLKSFQVKKGPASHQQGFLLPINHSG